MKILSGGQARGLPEGQVDQLVDGFRQPLVPDSVTLETISASATVVDISLAEPKRVGLIVVNNSDRIMYLAFGDSIPSASSHSLAFPPASEGVGYSYAVSAPLASQRVQAVWADGVSGNTVVTEALLL